MRDPHELLGVSRAANEEEIKRAFRQKAKLCHPDTHPNDPVIEREFRDLVTAYHEALKRRQEKDTRQEKTGTRFSDELKRAQSGTGSNLKAKNDSPAADRDIEDKIDILRHKRQRERRQSQKSKDQSLHQPPATKEASSNPFKTFIQDKIFSPFEDMIKQNLDSSAVNVKKAQKTTTKKTGKDHQYQLEVGFIEARTGGKVPLKLQNGRQINVKIAPETREGQTLRIQGLGEAANKNQTAGDAMVTINIVDDDYGERSNNDFFLRVPVTLTEATLGADILVPGLYQDNRVTIPENSNTGTNLRIKGKGFKTAEGEPPGDQYITLEVRLPNYPDKQLNAFLKKWSQDFDYDVRKHIGLGSIETTKKEGST